MGNPELQARETIDALLEKAGWMLSDAASANISSHRPDALAGLLDNASANGGASHAGVDEQPVTYLKDSKIPIAPLDQQVRIVAEIEKQFSRLDEAVANLRRYKAAVLKAAVEGKITEPC